MIFQRSRFYSIQERNQSIEKEKNKNKIFYFLNIRKNHEFKNIVLFYNIHSKKPANFFDLFFTFFQNRKKLQFYAIKFFSGFLITLYSYISYSHFSSSIDKFYGIRKLVLLKIELVKKSIQLSINRTKSSLNKREQGNFVEVENALRKFRLDVIEKLNNNLVFLENLSEKINNLPLTYFFFEKNKIFLTQLKKELRNFDTSGLKTNEKLHELIKKNHFLDFSENEIMIET